MKYEAVIFDFFGVICSEVAEFWFKRKNISSLTYEDFRQKYINPYDAGEISTQQSWEIFAELSKSSPQSVEEEWVDLAKVDREVVKLAQELSKRYRIAACTNASAGFFRLVLQANNLESLFSVAVISSEEKITKPDQRMYTTTLTRLGLDPEKVLFIDDRLRNIEAAKSIGIQSILFTSAHELRSTLHELGVFP